MKRTINPTCKESNTTNSLHLRVQLLLFTHHTAKAIEEGISESLPSSSKITLPAALTVSLATLKVAFNNIESALNQLLTEPETPPKTQTELQTQTENSAKNPKNFSAFRSLRLDKPTVTLINHPHMNTMRLIPESF